LNDRIRAALATDQTVDIITTGARSGLPRTTEIWFTNVSGRIIICGTPEAPRDWLANLIAHPEFTFRLKESVEAELSARAIPVRDPEQRRTLMSAPETQWYRDQVDSVEALIERSPVVDVSFTGAFAWLNP
jgi:deazaflavin-dependent oxidoreductase (nitroreductase family)